MVFSPRRAGMARRLPVPLWPSQDEALWSWILRLPHSGRHLSDSRR